MKLELNRIAKEPLYTIGRLFVDGKYFCDTLEDPVSYTHLTLPTMEAV